jgi:hypothetical protein
MSTSTDSYADLRMPLESQSNAGSDMSIFFITRLPLPKKFESPEQQQIKGLNFETIASVYFPPPPWLNNSDYAALQLQPNDDDDNDIHSALFSLNLSIYDQAITPSDWDDADFFLYGQVHPYALTWEIQPDNNWDADDEIRNYTIPSLIVRDLCYQP